MPHPSFCIESRCSNCAAWECITSTTGTCHRRSPQRFGDDIEGAFPLTCATNYCLDWFPIVLERNATSEESLWNAFRADLTVRANNCLDRAGIRSLAAFDALMDHQLLSIPHLGETTLRELREKRKVVR